MESYGPTSPPFEAVYTALVAGSIDAIMGMTRDGHITSWNAAAVDMYGYSIDEALGRPLAALFPEARRHEADEILRRSTLTGASCSSTPNTSGAVGPRWRFRCTCPPSGTKKVT